MQCGHIHVKVAVALRASATIATPCEDSHYSVTAENQELPLTRLVLGDESTAEDQKEQYKPSQGGTVWRGAL